MLPALAHPSPTFVRGSTVVGMCVVLVAGLVASAGLGLYPDEAYTAIHALRSTADFVDVTSKYELNQLAYYLLMRGWAVISIDPTWLRLPAITMVAGSVPVTVALARRLGLSTRVQALIPVLVAAHAGVAQFAVNARAYALAILLVPTVVVLWMRAVERGRRGDWVAFASAAVIGAYAHFYAPLAYVPAVVVLGMLHGIPPGRRRRAAIAAAAVAVGMLPIAAFALLAPGTNVEWITANPDEVVRGLRLLAGEPSAAGRLLMLPGLVLAALALGRLLSRSREGRAAALSLGLMACVPLVAGVATWLFRPLLVARYLTVSLPAVVVLLALCVEGRPAAEPGGPDATVGRDHRPTRRLTYAGLAAALLVAGLSMGTERLQRPDERQWDEAAAAMVAGIGRDDLLLIADDVPAAVQYHLLRRGLVTRDDLTALPWPSHQLADPGLDVRRLEAASTVWWVSRARSPEVPIVVVDAGLVVVEVQQFGRITLHRFGP